MDKKRLVASVLGVGRKKIWFSPENKKEIDESITAQDFRSLLKKGMVKKLPEKSHISIRKMEKKGKGRRKGGKNTKLTKKRRWVLKIRALRVELKRLKEQDRVSKEVYKDLYRKSGGGFFRDKSHLRIYLERNELLKSKK